MSTIGNNSLSELQNPPTAVSSSSQRDRVRRACEQCTSQKLRCTFKNADDSHCERCARLGKRCTERAAKSRKSRDGNGGVKRQIRELQKQVHDLTALVKPQSSTSISDASSITPTLSTSMPPPALPNTGLLPSSVPAPVPEATEGEGSSKLCKAIDIYFPFIQIYTAKHKPLVQTVMLMILHIHDNTYQITHGREILREIVNRVYMDGEANIEILQAVLLYAAWSHLHVRVNPQMETLVRLAQALVEKMGLHRPPVEASVVHSDEDLRAFLGVYYLSSRLSTSKQTGIALAKYSNYIGACYRELLDRSVGYVGTKEDARLVALVQIQHLVQRIADTVETNPTNPVRVSRWKELLDAIMEKVPSGRSTSTSHNPELVMLEMAFWHAHLRLYEAALNAEDLDAERKAASSEFLKMLARFTKASKAYLRVHQLLPEEHYAAFPLHVWEDSQHALASIIRFSKLLRDRGISQPQYLEEHLRREINCLIEVVQLRQDNSEAYDRSTDVFPVLLMRTELMEIWDTALNSTGSSDVDDDLGQAAKEIMASKDVQRFSNPLWLDLVKDSS